MPTKQTTTARSKLIAVEVCILAGGLSTRMGRDKARVRLGRRTLLGHVRVAAAETGWPVRVIRKDVVERCGPLGGILTGLQKSRAEVFVFLSCDMPFITASWLKKLVKERRRSGAQAVFTQQGKFAGFPFVLSRECLAVVEGQRVKGEFSLQGLAKALQAERVVVPEKGAWRFMNVNTPEALEEAKGRNS
ncbi:MAG: molybdenum cofactor guanylyltransferase [Verrucomicrobiota bacterium]